jgi:hypothetical protein
MKALSKIVLLGLLASVFIGRPAEGQVEAQRRQGFWFSAGVGDGSAIVTCDGCGGGRVGGPSGFLALGGTPNPHLQLGAETDLWFHSEQGVDLTIGTVTLTGYFYPSRTDGLFLKAGVGMAFSEASAGGQSVGHQGLGGLLGIGYDLPVSRKVSVVGYGSWNVGSLGSIGEFGTATENTYQFGLGIKID